MLKSGQNLINIFRLTRLLPVMLVEKLRRYKYVIKTCVSVSDARSTISAKEFCRSDSERGSLSSLEIDVRATEYSTRDSVTSLHYRSLQSQPPPPPVPIQVDAPVRPKHLQCSNTDIPTTRKRFHTAPREKHRVSKTLHMRARNGVPEFAHFAVDSSGRLKDRLGDFFSLTNTKFVFYYWFFYIYYIRSKFGRRFGDNMLHYGTSIRHRISNKKSSIF